MSTQEVEIPKWKQLQFTTNIVLLPQYKGKIAQLFSQGSYKGQGGEVVKQLGATEAQDSTGRNSDTPIMTTARDMRWVYPVKMEWGDLFDEEDLLETLADPTSAITQNAAIAMGRRKDTARAIPAFFGAAKTGPNGANTTAFINDGTQDVAKVVGSADEATATGMNTEKLKLLWSYFLRNEIDLDVEQINVALTAQDSFNLLKDIQFVNKDYRDTTVVDKTTGFITGYMGMNFVPCEKVPLNPADATERWNPAWVKSGMHYGSWMDMKVRAAPRPDKSFNTQVYLSQSGGATRLEEKKVFRIKNKVG